jgi:hypothetical protein
MFILQAKSRQELSIWILWVDDLLTIGKPSVVTKAKNDMMRQFECIDVGKVQEFLGNKIEIDSVTKTAKFTQPVLLQSLKDKFVLKKGKVKLPATAGSILSYKGEGVQYLTQTSSVISGRAWASFCICPSGQDWTSRMLFRNYRVE